MGEIVGGLSMSLDGFIARPDDSVGDLFEWYGNGAVQVDTADHHVFHVSEASAGELRRIQEQVGVVVTGRRLFDTTDGWGGRHPFGTPVVVVTHRDADDWVRAHPDAPYTFVEGVGAALDVAVELAAGQDVAVGGPDIIQQCLNLGRLDRVEVALVPLLIGEGIRFFDRLEHTPVRLTNPSVVEGDRVTHLVYRLA